MDTTILASIIGAALTLVVGIILLMAEGRTSWFKHQFSKQINTQLSDPITTNQLEINIGRIKWVFGTIVIAIPITIIIISLLMSAQISFLSEKLNTYEQSKEWQLPETLKALGEASKTINLSLEERKLFEEQKSSLQEAENRVSELEIENKDLQTKVEAFEALLLPPAEEFELGEGETKPLIGDSYYVGIDTITNSSVSMYLNNQYQIIGIGETKNLYAAGGIDCKLLLLGIQDSKARFSFRCQ